ncbi:MAG TPA: lipoate--protein ligase family protein [Fimbriiglobus sp.]|nr:lipoate--protein ligase family protein [Fimbriiglobus sp.]
MPPVVRLLPFETLPGPLNMAADEALLHATSAGGGASLRFYGWLRPTLSLGYFQPAADRLADPLLAALPWVRRATGGAALVHHHEVTYALALPPGKAWRAGEPWACRFHHIVTAALAGAGAETRSVPCGQEAKHGEVLCFLHQTPGDLVAGASCSLPPWGGGLGWGVEASTGREDRPRPVRLTPHPDPPPQGGREEERVGPAKVVGSAQRKQKGALLQHGGILLARSEFTPRLPGLFELTGVRLTAERVAELVAQRFAVDTGWELRPGDWTADELALRERIAAERYSSADWNAKR